MHVRVWVRVLAQSDSKPQNHAEASAILHKALRDGVQGEPLFRAIYNTYALSVESVDAKQLRREAVSYDSIARRRQPSAGRQEDVLRWGKLLAVAENAAKEYRPDMAVSDVRFSAEDSSAWPWDLTFQYDNVSTRRLSDLIFDITWKLGEHYASAGRAEADRCLAGVQAKLLWKIIPYAERRGILPPLWDELQEKPSWTCIPPRPLSSNEVKYEDAKQIHEPFRNQIVACVKFIAYDMGMDWKDQRTEELYIRVGKWHSKVHGHLIKKYRSNWKGGISSKIILTYVQDHIKDNS